MDPVGVIAIEDSFAVGVGHRAAVANFCTKQSLTVSESLRCRHNGAEMIQLRPGCGENIVDDTKSGGLEEDEEGEKRTWKECLKKRP